MHKTIQVWRHEGCRDHSLDPLSSHDLEHFLRAPFIQTSPSVPIPDVRLNVEALRSQPRVGLLLESRERGVMTEPRKEGPHRVRDMGDERCAVPKCYCSAQPCVNGCKSISIRDPAYALPVMLTERRRTARTTWRRSRFIVRGGSAKFKRQTSNTAL